MGIEEYQPKVSLIIPVYNVEQYLMKSLNSAVNQTMQGIEIIIVDDGSTDGSSEIINEFANKYDNIVVINQENMGLSQARNTGLKHAKGEYIAFLDSDDFIDKRFIETLYNISIKYDADISYCNYYIFFPNKNSKQYMPFTSRSAIYPNMVALRKLILDTTLHYYAWNKLYKKSLFWDNNIEFYDMLFEDIATIPRVFYCANKVAVTNEALYYYTKRRGSIIHSVNTKKMNDYTRSVGAIRNFLCENNLFESYKLAFKIYAYRAIIVNWYCIIDMHIRLSNFNLFFTNMKNAAKAICYFINDDYKPNEVIPDAPYLIKLPESKKLKNLIHKTSEK